MNRAYMLKEKFIFKTALVYELAFTATWYSGLNFL